MEVDESDKHSNLLRYVLSYGGKFFIMQAPEWHKIYNFSQPLLIPHSNGSKCHSQTLELIAIHS
jgi:hypothetical protein